MSSVMADLVVLDDDQACNGGGRGDIVESGVRVGALLLLLRGVGGLKDKDSLDEEEDGGGVEELVHAVSEWRGFVAVGFTYRMRRKQDEVVTEDAAPYDSCQYPHSSLSDYTGAYHHRQCRR